MSLVLSKFRKCSKIFVSVPEKESDPNDKLGVPLGELIKIMTREVPEERPVLEQVIRTLESLI